MTVYVVRIQYVLWVHSTVVGRGMVLGEIICLIVDSLVPVDS
jgi:hypothetical protein